MSSRGNRSNGQSEVERLRARLAEAEETLRAIRSGEVDAIMVEGPSGPQVYTLQSPDLPYRLFLEGMNEGAACISEEGIVSFSNQRLAEMVGRPAETIVGSPFTSLAPSSGKEWFAQLLKRGQQGGTREEAQFEREDGSLMPVLVSLKAVSSEQGDGLYLIAADLTLQQRAEAAARRSEERLQLQVERMPMGCITWDKDFRVRSWNAAAESIFGFKSEDVIGRHPYEFIVPEKEQPGVDAIFARLLEGDTSAHSTNENLTRDGCRIFCRWTNTPLREGSEVIGVLSIVEDITEGWRAEQEWQRTFDTVSDSVMLLDRELRIRRANRATIDLLGKPPEQVIGKHCYELVHHRNAPPENCPAARMLRSGQEERNDIEEPRLGMSFDVVATPLRDAGGNVTGCVHAIRDITERKRAEQRLREQAALLDLAHDAILLTDLNGRIVFWSRGATDTYGYTAEEASGQIASELLHTVFPTSPDLILNAIQMTREWEGELHHTCRNGNQIVVASRWSLLRGENGRSTAVLEINRDITARKRAEQELQKVSLYTRSLIEASLDPLVTISREGRITDANEATEKATGVNRERLIGSDFSEYFTEPERARAGYQQVFAAGFVRDYPLAIRHMSGQITDVLYNAAVFRDQRGQIEGVFAAARDVTERKRIEAALQSERQRFRDVLDKLPVYVVLLTPDYHASFANRDFRERFGEAHGKRCYEFLFGRTQPCEICETYKVLEKGCAQRWKWTGPDGRHYDIYDFPFSDTDGSPLIMEMGVDITERERAEAEVRKLNEDLEQRVATRTQELQAANRELEAFNYAVAHDLRAPLRHIHGFSEILADEAKTALDDSAQRHLQMIRDSVQHMSQLLEDLLRLSRLGRQEITRQVCGLKSVVDDAVNDLKPEIKGREVEWRIGELPFVECDPGLMKQVITNLLANALKFTRPRERAIIEIGQMTVDGETVVFVRDNGVGFNMKYADKLFTLFQRLHRQQDFEGTGVGLAIVQRIIHRHGGQVWAEGDLNKGATFYFKLRSCVTEPRGEPANVQVA